MTTKKVSRTFSARLHVAGTGKLPVIVSSVLENVITACGTGMQEILRLAKLALELVKDDDGVVRADLVFPCHKDDIYRAKKLLSRKIEVLYVDENLVSARERAMPRYANSYRLVALEDRDETQFLRFRLVERYGWGEGEKRKSAHVALSAKFLQQVILSWMKPPLGHLSKVLRPGICQAAGQQILSHIGLVEEGSQTHVSFPDIGERDPEIRFSNWQERLETVCTGNGDPKKLGSPFPGRMTGTFVQSADVVVYHRVWTDEHEKPQERLYVALPVFHGVDPGSPLGKLTREHKLFWWRSRVGEFEELPAWQNAKRTNRLKEKANVLLVPLENDQIGHFKRALSGENGRKIGWSIISERRVVRPDRRGQKSRWQASRLSETNMPQTANWRVRHGKVLHKTTDVLMQPTAEWHIHFATAREVEVSERPNVLGVHFGQDKAFWVLAEQSGNILEEGVLAHTILSVAEVATVDLFAERQAGRSIAGRSYRAEIKRRTEEVVRKILAFAHDNNAALALEDVSWVKKRSGTPMENIRATLWNYSRLAKMLEWMGLEWTDSVGTDSPVPIVARVGDYLLRFTCPSCGTCRKAGTAGTDQMTWREDETLHCRACNFAGSVPDDAQARLVASEGWKRVKARKLTPTPATQ